MNQCKKSTINMVKEILNKDMNTTQFIQIENKIVLTEAKRQPGARQFEIKPFHFQIASMGDVTVISAVKAHFPWINEHLINLERDELFSVKTMALMENYLNGFRLTLYGPDVKLICDQQHFIKSNLELPYDFEVTYTPETLYDHKEFKNALTYQENGVRKDVMAVICKDQDQIIGIACVTKDSEELYQVGVDVIEAYRHQKIGKELVSRLTELVFEAGKIPYYNTSLSHLQSRNLAVSLGYYPTWIELYTR